MSGSPDKMVKSHTWFLVILSFDGCKSELRVYQGCLPSESLEAVGKKKPEKIRASTGFEPVTSANTGAMLHQLSHEATRRERGQFIEFISPVRSEMM